MDQTRPMGMNAAQKSTLRKYTPAHDELLPATSAPRTATMLHEHIARLESRLEYPYEKRAHSRIASGRRLTLMFVLCLVADAERESSENMDNKEGTHTKWEANHHVRV